jgi:hypothetical protein
MQEAARAAFLFGVCAWLVVARLFGRQGALVGNAAVIRPRKRWVELHSE